MSFGDILTFLSRSTVGKSRSPEPLGPFKETDTLSCKDDNDEMTALLKRDPRDYTVEKQVGRAPIYPKIFGVLILGTIWLSVALSTLVPKSTMNLSTFRINNTKYFWIPDLGALPILAPEVCQFGMTFASLAAMMTIYCFHSTIKQKFSVPEHRSKGVIVFISGLAGSLAMICLILYAFLPDLTLRYSLPLLGVHENVFMLAFFLCALLHACTTLKFVLDVRNDEILPEKTSKWLKLKLFLIIVLVLVSVAFLSLFLILSQNEHFVTQLLSERHITIVKVVYRALSYSLLHLHIFYMITFVYDLEYVSVHLHFHPDSNYFDTSSKLYWVKDREV